MCGGGAVGIHGPSIPLRHPRCLDGRGLQLARTAGASRQDHAGRHTGGYLCRAGGGQVRRAAPHQGRQRRMSASVQSTQAKPLDRRPVPASADVEALAQRQVTCNELDHGQHGHLHHAGLVRMGLGLLQSLERGRRIAIPSRARTHPPTPSVSSCRTTERWSSSTPWTRKKKHAAPISVGTPPWA